MSPYNGGSFLLKLVSMANEIENVAEDFKCYLLSLNGAFKIDKDTIGFNSKDKLGTITFYVPYVEIKITENGENIFILQTELVSKTQVDEYLVSFFECLYTKEDRDLKLDAISHEEHKILFVCSSGVFSSILAKNCEQKAKSLNIKAEYGFCSIDRLTGLQEKYDRVYFLPQISYVLRREDFSFKNKIKVLPTTYVALNDIDSILSYTLNPRL